MVEIVTVDTVTKLDEGHRGKVLIGGSHGGVYAGYLAARAGVRAVILNNAGVGRDSAGIGSLAYLDRLGLAAATVSHETARIGDGGDMAARGVISHVNRTAEALGCAAGQACRDCAARMRDAAPATAVPPLYEEARFLLRAAPDTPGAPEVWGLDSASLIGPDDDGRICITASHGALLGGKPDHAIRARPAAAVFNDAGVGIDDIGISRLPALADRGIPAATVAAASVRIGDARSAWETGIISHVDAPAAALGAAPGQDLQTFVDLVIAHQSPIRIKAPRED
ncbi:MAG: hypothetical protein QF926_15540 [Alphaproteobacteria bacterium]|jgi:hypothetical protein|nr:hypothetical protein [Alphaproteobacteria bacterium]MDP6518018.1 hypothetical protein [Alphaproteobacteria bacterium]